MQYRAEMLPQMPTMPLEEWGAAMRAEGLAERTVTERPRVVARAARVMRCDVAAMTTAGITEWLAGQSSPGTRATYFGALRAWHMWLLRNGHRADNPMELMRTPRVPRRLPRPVATANLEILLASPLQPITRVKIHLASYQGLRVHEVAKVRGEDVDLVAGTLRVLGKGGAEDYLPLHPQIVADAQTMPRRGWWFPRPDGTWHVRRDSVSSVISRAMHRAGVPGTAHQLRHWYGTELIRSGTDVRIAQTLLRHASLATTAIYTAIDSDQQRDAVARLPILRTAA